MTKNQSSFEDEARQRSGGLLSEYKDFLLHNKKWWLIPIVVALLLVGRAGDPRKHRSRPLHLHAVLGSRACRPEPPRREGAHFRADERSCSSAGHCLAQRCWRPCWVKGYSGCSKRERARRSWPRAPGASTAPIRRWGWRATPGWFRRATTEFDITGDVNALYMNDYPVDAVADAERTRVLALGDSHTFAIGASMDETWVKVLERRLNEKGDAAFRIYNAAAIGYNLHQYLLRLIDQGPGLQPDYVVVGLSYATDFYDLIPPDRGGWIYGAPLERDYFDFDESGELELLHWEPGVAEGESVVSPASRVRSLLSGIGGIPFLAPLEAGALHRQPRPCRRPIAVAQHGDRRRARDQPGARVPVATGPGAAAADPRRNPQARRRARRGRHSLPGPDLRRRVGTSRSAGTGATAGTAAGERVGGWCAERGIGYVDTLDAFRERVAELDRWLHHRKDAHPTAEGHELIADTIADSKLLLPR